MLRLLPTLFLLFIGHIAGGQSRPAIERRVLQLGVIPGLSSNGLNPGEYINDISLNIITGYGRSTRFFELNGISGFTTNSSSGIHISGLANFIGGNALVGKTQKEKNEEMKKGFETSLNGFQISGLLNYVRSNTEGAQFTIGLNTTKNYLQGSQFAGLFNFVGGFTIGTQVSVLANFSKKSISGAQISGLLNFTNGSHSGIQLATVNHAGLIRSTKGASTSTSTGLQIGVANISGDMGGYQIGLINFGKKTPGTQIGLINIFRSASQADEKDSPAYGLLNLGDYVNPRVYVSDLFLTNYGLYTGKGLNLRVISAPRNVYTYNEIAYSTNYQTDNDINWGISYRAGIVSFYKSADITSHKNYFSFTAEMGHVDWKMEKEKRINLRYALLAEAGFRPFQKASFFYPFAAVSYNFIPHAEGSIPDILTISIGEGAMWLGYVVGVMLH